MLEQEIASAIKFILESADNPAPYYYEVPQDFLVPAVYFPPPEILSRGDTLATYALEYSWYVKFFHKDAQSAHALGMAALTALQYKKNIVALIDTAGELTGRGFRMNDPALKIIDDGAVQLALSWDSRRPYYREPVQKMMKFHANYVIKSYETAIKQINKNI
jgi:hypothetical protein